MLTDDTVLKLAEKVKDLTVLESDVFSDMALGLLKLPNTFLNRKIISACMNALLMKLVEDGKVILVRKETP